VLGVDPGLTRCGIGVVDGSPGRALRLAYVDVVRTPAELDVGERLLTQADAIAAAIASYAPDVVAVERVFSQHNVRTVMGTAQVAGLAIVAAARAGIPVALHTPSEVKAAVTGSGTAGKTQVATMVTR
jgi:crossover junction endodeoxyribonuclease RuvC